MRRHTPYSTIALILTLLALLYTVLPAAAQKNPPGRVQEFTGNINSSAEVILYHLRGLQTGQTLYAYVEATSGSLDTYLGLGSSDFTRVFREDDDSGGNYNSALEFAVQEAGDYQLAVTRYDDSTQGSFRLLIGIDTPAVLNGHAQPYGAEFATLYGSASRDSIRLNGMGLNYTDCSTLVTRPRLSGPEQTRETRNFILHYTTSGSDASSLSYVDAVEAVLDDIWKKEVYGMGWPAPPPDCGEGGDARYDIYLMDTLSDTDALGYTEPDALLGDNPNTATVTENWASYSHIVVDNDFQGYGDALAIMRATTAHEFHHAIQFGYDINDSGYWLYEATATWMETQVFPEDEEATPYVGDLFATPDLCIGADPADERFSTRIYAEWLLIESLVQDYGTEVVGQLWDLISVHEGMENFYVLAEDLGTTPQRIMQRFAIRNLLRDYAMAGNFTSRVRVEALVDGIGQITPRQSGVQQLGVDYILITQPGVYQLEITQPNLTMTAVGVRTKTGEAHIYDLGKRGTLDTTQFQHTYIILLNVDTHADSDSCTQTNWVLNVRDGSGQPLTNAEPKVWYAPNFLPAR
jgi:hypothetical protein